MGETLAQLEADVAHFMACSEGDLAQLLGRVRRWQGVHVPEVARLDAALGPGPIPISLFRHARVYPKDAPAPAQIFRSSGTTAADRALHALPSTALYRQAALEGARRQLFAAGEPTQLVLLAPSPRSHPASSLGQMLHFFEEAFAAQPSEWLPIDAPAQALKRLRELCAAEATPICLFATALALLALMEQGDCTLPQGSQVVQTGGLKSLDAHFDFAFLAQRCAEQLQIDPAQQLWSEYGMTELSSQLYAPPAARNPRYEAPPWVRLSVLDAEQGTLCGTGSVGRIRIEDLANVYTCCDILTEDLGRLDERGGLTLLGRQQVAPLRGCSTLGAP